MISVTFPVFWGDLDLYGHVNNTVFFRWFEQARMAYLERCGMVESHDKDRIGAILHSTSCRFRAPVFHPDTIEVSASVTDVGEDRFTMSYVARSLTREVVVGEGTAVVVSFDYTAGRKTPIPPHVRSAIERLRAGA